MAVIWSAEESEKNQSCLTNSTLIKEWGLEYKSNGHPKLQIVSAETIQEPVLAYFDVKVSWPVSRRQDVSVVPNRKRLFTMMKPTEWVDNCFIQDVTSDDQFWKNIYAARINTTPAATNNKKRASGCQDITTGKVAKRGSFINKKGTNTKVHNYPRQDDASSASSTTY